MKKNILEIKKICSANLEYMHEKMHGLLNEITVELSYLNKNEDSKVNLALIDKVFNEVKPKIEHVIKHDSAFILPYIKNCLDLLEKDSNEAHKHFLNLKGPVNQLIKKQGEIMNLLNKLRAGTNNYNLFFEKNNMCRKVIIDLFELTQTVEKYIFIEENMLIPSLLHLFQVEPVNVKLN